MVEEIQISEEEEALLVLIVYIPLICLAFIIIWYSHIFLPRVDQGFTSIIAFSILITLTFTMILKIKEIYTERPIEVQRKYTLEELEKLRKYFDAD